MDLIFQMLLIYNDYVNKQLHILIIIQNIFYY